MNKNSLQEAGEKAKKEAEEKRKIEFRITNVSTINENNIIVHFVYGKRLMLLRLLEKDYEENKKNILPEQEAEKEQEFEDEKDKLINGYATKYVNDDKGYTSKDFICGSRELEGFLAVVESDRETLKPEYIDTRDKNNFCKLEGRRGFMNIKKETNFATMDIKEIPFAFYPVHKDLKDLKNIFLNLPKKDLLKTLDLTIKQDVNNKLLYFYTYLSVFAPQGLQMNLFVSGFPGSGKTYTGEEVGRIYPKDIEVIKRTCTPRALNKNMDWKGKILVFQDLFDHRVLEFMRTTASHDGEVGEEGINASMIPNSHKPIETIWIYFPAVLYRTATFELEKEEDRRRNWNISPENTPEKYREMKALNDKYPSYRTNPEFREFVFNNQARRLLMELILYIRQAEIKDITIGNEKYLAEKTKDVFLDIEHLYILIRLIALLNCFQRMNDDGVVVANKQDIDDGIEIFNSFSRSRELRIAPCYLEAYNNVLIPVFKEKNNNGTENIGLKKQEIKDKYFQIHKKNIDEFVLVKVIKQWEYANLIEYKKNPEKGHGREKLIFPVSL